MKKITFLNLDRKICLYDGFEPDNYQQEFQLSEEFGSLRFTLTEILDQPFKNLGKILDSETFKQFAAAQKLKNQNTEWETFVGNGDLSLYYFIRGNKLILVSFGEFQPMRYMIYLESVWQIKESGKLI